MLKKIFVVLIIGIVVFVVARQFGSKTTSKKPSVDITNKENSQQNKKPILGIHYRMIDKKTADQNSLIEGAYITQIVKDTPAEKNNLQEEDIITKVDNIKINSGDKEFLSQLISKKKLGDQIDIEIWRNKEIKNILITLD